jgi:hypothetical protein
MLAALCIGGLNYLTITAGQAVPTTAVIASTQEYGNAGQKIIGNVN